MQGHKVKKEPTKDAFLKLENIKNAYYDEADALRMQRKTNGASAAYSRKSKMQSALSSCSGPKVDNITFH